MLKNERQEAILEILKEKKYATVTELSKTLYVAPITVRRDLDEMEIEGLLQRCHGGASLKEFQNREIPFELRNRENYAIKSEIGKKATKYICEGDTIFLDASTTALHITDYITAEQNLTVITNSIKVVEKLKGKQIKCYLTGGMLLENSHALVGSVTEDTVASLYADLCFFSSQGITEEGIITDFSETETKVRKQMIRHSKKSIFLFDRSKVGKKFLFKVADVEDIYAVVTNDDDFAFLQKADEVIEG